MARPTKFTRETVNRLLKGIRLGMTYEHACMFAGVSYDVFNRWRKGTFPRNLDDDQKQLKGEFREALTRAEGDMVARTFGLIQQAAVQGDWRAATWIMERRYPSIYGKNVMEHVGKDGGPIQISPEARKIAEKLAESLGIEPDELIAEAEAVAAAQWEKG